MGTFTDIIQQYSHMFFELKTSEPVMFYFILVVLLIFLLAITWSIIDGFILNLLAPTYVVDAKVVGKATRRSSSNSMYTGNGRSFSYGSATNSYSGMVSNNTNYSYSYSLVFETSERDRLVFKVSERMFNKYIEGDSGELTYRRKWLRRFELD